MSLFPFGQVFSFAVRIDRVWLFAPSRAGPFGSSRRRTRDRCRILFLHLRAVLSFFPSLPNDPSRGHSAAEKTVHVYHPSL